MAHQTEESRMKRTKPKPRKLTLVDSSYDPTKAELEEEFEIDATFEELTRAVVQPVDIQFTKNPDKSQKTAE